MTFGFFDPTLRTDPVRPSGVCATASTRGGCGVAANVHGFRAARDVIPYLTPLSPGMQGGKIVRSIEGAQAPAHHRAHVARRVSQPVIRAHRSSSLAARSSSPTAQRTSTGTAARHGLPTPPSKSLGYLAVGRSATKARSGSGASGGTGEASARIASATGTSTRSESTAATETAAPPPSENPTSSTQSGGGTSLGYLGRDEPAQTTSSRARLGVCVTAADHARSLQGDRRRGRAVAGLGGGSQPGIAGR